MISPSHLDAGLQINIQYPQGSQEEPASHFLEHMLYVPTGLGHLQDLLPQSGITYSGRTGRNHTTITAHAAPSLFQSLEETNKVIAKQVACLAFGMTVLPDITPQIVERERLRMRTEFQKRETEVNTHIYDFILPMITLGSDFAPSHQRRSYLYEQKTYMLYFLGVPTIK